MAEAQHPACKLVTFRHDKGAEFIGNRIADCTRSMAYKPSTQCAQPLNRLGEQSGFRDLAEIATCILVRAGLARAAAHASNYIYNQLPHSGVGCSPFEFWYGYKPNIANLCVWGCLAYVHLQAAQSPCKLAQGSAIPGPSHTEHRDLQHCGYLAVNNSPDHWFEPCKHPKCLKSHLFSLQTSYHVHQRRLRRRFRSQML